MRQRLPEKPSVLPPVSDDALRHLKALVLVRDAVRARGSLGARHVD
jgi:hypothetical protein